MRTEQYPLIPLRDLVVFPNTMIPVYVGREKSVEALRVAMETDRRLFLVLQRDAKVEDPAQDDLHQVGIIGEVLQELRLPDGTLKLLIEGKNAAEISGVTSDTRCSFVTVKPREHISGEGEAAETARLALVKMFDEFVSGTKKLNAELHESIKKIADFSKLTYTIASNIHLKTHILQEILEEADPVARAELVMQHMVTELEVVKLDDRIKDRVKAQMTKAQREYYLNEQMKAIQKEMGKDDDMAADIEEFSHKIENGKMPQHVQEKARRELKRLKGMAPMSAESAVARNYMEWLVNIPWGEYTEDIMDVKHAETILNRDHYGLEKPKERILEFLAVRQLAKDLKGPIICLVGPPGVGKTSLARSVAESMGKKFVRMSLGGVRDEAEIRGHRRTYIGSLPGKVVQHIRKAGSMNPVFLLDEIDKLGADFRGDPSSALLETLDPEQNSSFNDHYLEVDLDLSKVFFLTTANSLESIPGPLLDRMEVIRVPGYTEFEKLAIAKNFIVPKQLKEHGLDAERVRITDDAVTEVIRYYTKEAGVRNLEREIASLVRKSARKLVSDNRLKKVRINDKAIEKYLGQRKFRSGGVYDEWETGVATGLAWTPYGGDLLQIEVAQFAGNGNLMVTGKLGEVMQESAKTALSVVKSRARQFDIPGYKFKEFDIHLHVPEGAVPKDGPSAGITMATALLSALSERPANCRIAMTGEITLRGRVLAIGGLKEKVLAAHRAGIREVILPMENKKDLTEIPADVRSEVQFHCVESIDDVFAIVLKSQERR